MRNLVRLILCLALVLACVSLASCEQVPENLLDLCEHTLEDHDGQDPTCTDFGWKAYQTCTTCKLYTTYERIEPLGHDYSDGYVANGDVHTATCTRCSLDLHAPHDWELTENVAATCETEGFEKHECAICGAEKTDVTAALGHSYPESYKPNGDVHTLSCSECDYTVSGEHNWKITHITAPTCTSTGTDNHKCIDCGAGKLVTVPMIAHNYSESYTENGDVHSLFCTVCNDTTADHPHAWQSTGVLTQPTCTTDGVESLVCSVCQATAKGSISAFGHDFADEYTSAGDVHSLACTRCTATTASNPHTWQSTGVLTQPTCTTDGVESLVCSVCQAIAKGSISALGHDFADEYTSAGDVHSLACSRCTATTAPNPHDWQVAEITTQPTCTESGVSRLVCSVCGAESTGTALPLGHDFSLESDPNDEVQTIGCSRCSATTVAHQHDWRSVGVTTQPTCISVGIEKLVCSICQTEKSVNISALGHNFVDEYKSDGDVHSLFCSRCTATIGSHPHVWQSTGIVVAPTCTSTGTEAFACSVCDAEKIENLPMIDHVAGEWIIIQHATALESGMTTLKCGLCGNDWYSVKIPADVELIPNVYLTGAYQNATASKNEVEMEVSYVDPTGELSFDAYATIKVQGSSSAAYEKKNYTIKFYKDSTYDKKLKVDFGWGKESKYVMKANWVDFSQARNVVSCRLWGDIVKSRAVSANQQKLAALATNGGAIDGFPIAVFMNGVFHGLYTMNVPKDEWMFGMGDSETEALIAADNWVATDFYSLLDGFIVDKNGDLTCNSMGWELRYYGTEETTGSHQWVTDSFNNLIRFCQNNQGEAFKAGISNYLDVDSAIDYLIFMYANCMHDNASKNMLWATYDGKTWIPTVYDQDGTFGQVWDGIRQSSPTSSLPSVKNGKIDVGINYGPPEPADSSMPRFILWDRMWNAFTKEILDRYAELRSTVLSTQNMIAELSAFEEAIPASLYEAEVERWRDARAAWWDKSPYTQAGSSWDYTEYHFDYMYEWVAARMTSYDNAIKKIANTYGYSY